MQIGKRGAEVFKPGIPKLRTICFLTVSVIVFILSVGCTDDKNYLHDDTVSSYEENILFQGTISGNSGDFITNELSAQTGNGRVIHLKFRNDGKEKVLVDLRKRSIFSKNNIVMSFDVEPGDEVSNDYRSADSDSGKYSVKIISNSGPDVSGYLDIMQVT